MAEFKKPIKYSVEQLQDIIDKYFETTPFDVWTVTGLALCVGSKQLLSDYEKRDAYRDMVRVARLKVENAYEQSLRIKGGAGNIFALKNFGWRDQQEVDLNHSHTGPATIIFGDNSEKESDDNIT